MEIKQNEEKNGMNMKEQIEETLINPAVDENANSEDELNSENVHKIFQDCLFKQTEINNNAPTVEFNYVEGIKHKVLFSTERLNNNKMKIAKLIDMLPLIPLPEPILVGKSSVSSLPQSFLCLCCDKNGRLWTGDHQTMEFLMVLGIACGIIEYAIPREKWGELAGSVPVIHKIEKDPNEVIIGEAPEAYSKYVTEEEKKQQKEEIERLKKQVALAKEEFNAHYKDAAPVLEMLGYSMGMEGENYYLYDNKGEKLCELSVNVVLGGFNYSGIVNDTKVEYTYSHSGKNSDGGLVYCNTVTVNNIKERDGAYYGKEVKIELGVGILNVSDVPRIEITITEPDSLDEKITKYYATPYNMSFEIENNFGSYGNYKDGTDRAVYYTNTTTNPFVNQGALLIHESQEHGAAYNISIDRINTHPEYPAKYAHRTAYYKVGTSTDPDTTEYSFEWQGTANQLACEYLKTPRVKNLYYHILERIEAEVSGMKDYIHKNYPFIEEVENVLAQEPNSEQEELINSFAIEGADLKCEKARRALKELKNKQQ